MRRSKIIWQWCPTHAIRYEGKWFEVQLEDNGYAFTREEWSRSVISRWTREKDGKWTLDRKPAPKDFIVRKLTERELMEGYRSST